MFPVVLDQVCTHCSRDFSPLLHTGLLQIVQVLGSFSSLHRFSIGSRSGHWLGHSRSLKCFLRSHSLVALVCVWGHCHAGRPSHDPSSVLLLREGGCWPKSRDKWPHPSTPQYGAVVLSPLQKSTPKAWCFHPHASRLGWCSWDCAHSSSSSGEWSLYQKVIFWSHLTTWPSPMPPLDHPDGLWQTSDGPGHVLAWAGGPCARCRILIHDGVVCY